MKRDILKIDEDLCNGCGVCVPNCHEGALQVIDGKVRLVSELMCDGLGACIGYCPEGAITIETREAEPYNEKAVMEKMKDKGKNTIIAHLKHLKDHGETGFLQDGVSYLKEHRSELSFSLDEVMITVHNHGKAAMPHQLIQNQSNIHAHSHAHEGGGCPGSRALVIEKPAHAQNQGESVDQPSELRQWPVQMHLVNPAASYFKGSDLLLAADCVAFSMGGFHNKHLKGKSLGVTRPGDLSARLSLAVLRKFNMADEVAIRPIGGSQSERYQAMASNVVQGVVVTPPLDVRAKNDGFNVLYRLVDLDLPFIYSSLHANSRILRDKPEVVQRVVAAFAEAIFFMEKNPGKGKIAISQAMQVKDEEALRVSYNVYAKEIIDRRMIVPAAAVADSVELVRASGTPVRKRPDEIYDNNFVYNLEKSGFLKELWGSELPRAGR